MMPLSPSHLLAGLLLTLLLLCGAPGVVQAQDASGVCRVTTNGSAGNKGANWGHSKTLMAALIDYHCDEIWAAEGTYFTDAYPNYFSVAPNLRVYGGFAGNETHRDQRDPWAHVTVLSGDKDHNDIDTDGNSIDESAADIRGTNSQHVVKMDASPSTPITHATVLDGFTITGGDARSIIGYGGGLICHGAGAGNHCSPTLSNLVFAGNAAVFGGAVYLEGGEKGNSSPTISDVVFTRNIASGGSQTYGGAFYCNAKSEGTCNPTLTNVLFAYNDSDYYGGAMWNDAELGGTSSPTLTNVTFDHNTSNYQGGAMENYGFGGTSSPNLYDVTFSNNSSGLGGAMYNLAAKDNGYPGTSHQQLSNVTFFNNSAGTRGGAIFNNSFKAGTVASTLTNVTFSNNSANRAGGAIYNTGATGIGTGEANVSLTNVILWNNSSAAPDPEHPEKGGANIYVDDTNYDHTSLSVNFSIVQGGDGSITYKTKKASTAFANGFNYDGDPGLGPLADNGGQTLTMVPGATGYAVDNGICTTALPLPPVPPVDQRGVSRGMNGGCDIGAVEALTDAIFADGFEKH